MSIIYFKKIYIFLILIHIKQNTEKENYLSLTLAFNLVSTVSIILPNTCITSSSFNVRESSLNVREYAIDFSSLPTLSPVYISNTSILSSNLAPAFFITSVISLLVISLFTTKATSFTMIGYLDDSLNLIGLIFLLHNWIVAVHIINGLPYETKDIMLDTIKHLNTLDI